MSSCPRLSEFDDPSGPKLRIKPVEKKEKAIPGLPGYTASDVDGDIRETATGVLLDHWTDADGYHNVVVMIRGKPRIRKVSILVAQTWVDHPDDPKKNEVGHVNADKDNNDAANLKWITHAENAKQRWADERARGINTQRHDAVTRQQAGEIKWLAGLWPYTRIATHYGISRQHAGNIARGKRWPAAQPCKPAWFTGPEERTGQLGPGGALGRRIKAGQRKARIAWSRALRS